LTFTGAHGIPFIAMTEPPVYHLLANLRRAGVRVLVAAFIVSAAAASQPRPMLSIESPLGFFTNVAARLLRSQLNLELNQIQVYPTNQYTPAVHRLLQVAANLYEATTNRDFSGAGYPYCPSVFRPLYRRTIIGSNTVVIIAGFREVQGTTIITPGVGSAEIELDSNPANITAIPPLGTPFGPERTEPLISGQPLIIGVRKGFPNFNEFAMQTYINVSRLLEFRRNPGDTQGPIISTNQMYIAAITNVFGLEAWNAYTNSYPRPLQMACVANMTALMTNETGVMLLSNRVTRTTGSLDIAANSWPGWTTPAAVRSSFVLPWGTNSSFVFLTNSSYNSSLQQLVPLTHVFNPATRDRYDVPHWWPNLNIRLRYVLVDTLANRIVDYVDLNRWQPTMDLDYLLAPPGTDCSGDPGSLTDNSVMLCTNRISGTFNPSVPTMGLLNQMELGLGMNPSVNLQSYSLDPYAGPDAERAVDGFRYNLLGWAPIYPVDIGRVFYKSNTFYAPLLPFKPGFVHTSWPANDPLVHFTLPDLTDLTTPPTNVVDFAPQVPPLENLGFPNHRYDPWGGNPFGSPNNPVIPAFQMAAKDPWVLRPDDWNFPVNQPLSPIWLGRVHRGTPWQTLCLKSTNILQQFTNSSQSLRAWQVWTGDALAGPSPAPGGTGLPDGWFTAPTNDWSVVGLLAPLFNTNAPLTLNSANQSPATWTALLDGMTVLTNVANGQSQPVLMSSNSPQAAIIADGLEHTRASQAGGFFRGIGDILATPELSTASPWLNSALSPTEEASECIPAQLLSILRPDSFATPSRAGGQMKVQFTGSDAYIYGVQVSQDLIHWSTVTTNQPEGGVFEFSEPLTPNTAARFYRSALVP
jgi:hypothetical protein